MGPSAAAVTVDATVSQPDILSEKLRLVWVCCAAAAVEAAVLAAPVVALQATARSTLQESFWRHTHAQVRSHPQALPHCAEDTIVSLCQSI